MGRSVRRPYPTRRRRSHRRSHFGPAKIPLPIPTPRLGPSPSPSPAPAPGLGSSPISENVISYPSRFVPSCSAPTWDTTPTRSRSHLSRIGTQSTQPRPARLVSSPVFNRVVVPFPSRPATPRSRPIPSYPIPSHQSRSPPPPVREFLYPFADPAHLHRLPPPGRRGCTTQLNSTQLSTTRLRDEQHWATIATEGSLLHNPRLRPRSRVLPRFLRALRDTGPRRRSEKASGPSRRKIGKFPHDARPLRNEEMYVRGSWAECVRRVPCRSVRLSQG